MRRYIVSTAFLFCGILVFAQPPRIDMAEAHHPLRLERYGNGITRYLVEGDMWQRRGEWERAILAYDNAIAQWPHWAPAYARRATALLRQGRETEARADLRKANRLSPISAQLFTENAAPYRYQLLSTDQLDVQPEGNDALASVHTYKRQGQLELAWQAIESLDLNGELASIELALLRGNWHILNQDNLGAIYHYDWALQRSDQPELLHNRGLAHILAYNFANGCADLEAAYQQGVDESGALLRELCGH